MSHTSVDSRPVHPLAPLRRSGFRYFLGVRFGSMFGSTIAPIALAFAILDISHSASALGLVLAIRHIPMLVLMLYGGVIADRFPRHLVLAIANAVCCLTQLLAAALLLTGVAEVWQLAVIEGVNGAAVAFTLPAIQGVIPHVVPHDEIPQANALGGLVRTVTLISGASVGGTIVAIAGAGWGIAVDAATFGCAAAFASRLKLAPLERPSASTTLHDLRAGWSEIVTRQWALVGMAAFGLFNAVQDGVFLTLGPAVANQSFGRLYWGLLNAALTAGMAVGAHALLKLRPRYPLRVGMLGRLCEVPLILALGVAPSTVLLIPLAAVAGAGVALLSVSWDTALQQHIPSDKLSRVVSFDNLGSFVAIPVSQAAVGPLAETFGIAEVIVAGGILYGGVALLALSNRSFREFSRFVDVRSSSTS
jgi:MFS family permease